MNIVHICHAKPTSVRNKQGYLRTAAGQVVEVLFKQLLHLKIVLKFLEDLFWVYLRFKYMSTLKMMHKQYAAADYAGKKI